MSTNYRIIPLDLTNARDHAAIDGQSGFKDAKVDGISVLGYPAGAILSLHLGPTGDEIDVTQALQNIEGICENDGIFATNPAQPGTIVRLYISFGGGGAIRGQ